MIDLHCHILPGLDDGAADRDESIEMAKQAVSDGIRAIVATPHTLNERYFNPADKVCRHLKALQAVFLESRLPLTLYAGSDARLCLGMAEKILSGEVATINENGRYVLVELPQEIFLQRSKAELFQLIVKGVVPIISHPERHPGFQQDLDGVYELVRMGCLLQLTAQSITGEFGHGIMNCAHRLIELRLAHLIATDAHSPHHRPPVLSKALEVAERIMGDRKEALQMVCGRPEAILEGEPLILPDPRQPTGRKRWWFGLFTIDNP